jgi:hypothetical protein
MSSKTILTASAAAFGIFGAGWLLVPQKLYEYWAIVGDTSRYGPPLRGVHAVLMVVRGSRNAQHPARRAILVGSFVGWCSPTA